jgi:hypothetical protein
MDDCPQLIERHGAGGIDRDLEHNGAADCIKCARALAANNLAGFEEQEDLVAGGRIDEPARALRDGE